MKSIFLFWFVYQMLASPACLSLPAGSPPQSSRQALPAGEADRTTLKQWRPATFRGLTMGSATREEMLRILGRPESSHEYSKTAGREKTESGTKYLYKNAADLPGYVEVIVNGAGLVRSVVLRPDKLSKDAAVRHFGSDFVVTKYETDDCVDAEAVPIYESPEGTWVLHEYRERGILFRVNDQELVDEIVYVSEPPGAAASQCGDR